MFSFSLLSRGFFEKLLNKTERKQSESNFNLTKETHNGRKIQIT